MKIRVIILILMAAFIGFTFCDTALAATSNTVNHELVTSSYTDLLVSQVTVPVKGVKGGSITVSNSVKNRGSKISGGFWLNFFMKTSSVSPNIFVGRRYVNHLDPGAVNSQKTVIKVPNTITCSNYYIRAYADFYNNVTEYNEANNYLYSQTKVNIINCRPVYITSDNIQTLTKDTNRVNGIVSSLKSMGLIAVNWGIGPNKHYSILTNKTIPTNALIVNIYGGVCAGTIWEMNLPYFKNLIGDKKIFTIWINTSTNINNVTFLPRSRDDNFTPIYGKTNGFPNVYDLDNDGIELPGEDGLMYPAKLLANWGYHFFYLPNGDVASLVSRIFSESLSM